MKQNKFITWLDKLLKDERGEPSVNPLISLLGTSCLIICLFVNLFVHITPSQLLVDAIVIIICVGMGSNTVDKFSFKKDKKDETKNDNTPDI